MEIGCEKCGTKFDLDESVLKAEGSKVRCSICRHVFKVYPPEPKATTKAEPEEKAEPETAKGFEAASASEAGPDGSVEEEAKEILQDEDTFQLDAAPEETEARREQDFEELLEDARRAIEEEETGPSEKEAGGEPAEETESLRPVRAVGDDAGPEAPEPMEEESAERGKRPGKSRFWLVFLIILLVAAGAAAGLYYFRPAEKTEATDPGVRRLSFESVSSSFVASKGAGLLFVIRGVVKNNYPQGRSHIRVKASVLDDRGQVVRQKLAYGGNTYTEEEIKILPLPEIAKAMENENGMTNENVNLAPGKSIPFMIVFDNFPENLSEFTVEAVSSSPATP